MIKVLFFLSGFPGLIPRLTILAQRADVPQVYTTNILTGKEEHGSCRQTNKKGFQGGMKIVGRKCNRLFTEAQGHNHKASA